MGTIKTIWDLENDIFTGEYKNWTATEYQAWDPEYVKLTPDEEAELIKASKQIEEGDHVEWKPDS